MENVPTIENLLIFMGGGLAVILIKSFLPSYLGEKAKNLATKDDIEEIQKKIEQVSLQYSQVLEATKTKLQIESSLKQVFVGNCLETIKEVDDVLVSITIYCWAKLSEISPNENYVWSSVGETDKKWNFCYFRVSIDKIHLQHALYLTLNARESLDTLAEKIGMLSSMELALTHENPDPAVIDSAEYGYRSAIVAIEICRDALMTELGLIKT